MKVSAEFAQQQLDRARQIFGSRVIVGQAQVGELVTLIIQGNGNMLQTRAAMIYNVRATSQAQYQEGKKALGTAAFMAAIEDLDEAGVQAHINEILNASQLSFTVPLSSSVTFTNGEIVNALIEEYTPKATDENPTPSKRIGLNNVTPKKAVALSRTTTNWDEDEDATLVDNTDSNSQPQGNAEDPFADANVVSEDAGAGATA